MKRIYLCLAHMSGEEQNGVIAHRKDCTTMYINFMKLTEDEVS